MNIQQKDVDFIKHTLLPWSGVRAVHIAYSSSTKKWPDIWVERNGIPRITVTREWIRQDTPERQKRLVHEFLHLCGMEHDESVGYSTIPIQDSLSKRVYRRLINGGKL